jgi:hypothetical protein
MIHINVNDTGLAKPFWKKIRLKNVNLKNVTKAAFAPHLLLSKKAQGKIAKAAFAPHLLLKNKNKRLVRSNPVKSTTIKRQTNGICTCR